MSAEEQVREALELVRPAMKKDDGDFTLEKIDNSKVYIRLTGSCIGCPSVRTHLQRAIKSALTLKAPTIDELIILMPDGQELTTKPDPNNVYAGMKRLEGVKLVIAVASGKGGVGKSTVAVNLALALKARGLKVGLLDADLYGPSTPTMLGIKEAPVSVYKLLKPASAFGLKVMSVGFFVKTAAAMIWRGPMVMKAIDQLLTEVDWGNLDCMVIDMPPGTGDVQLSLAQRIPIDGTVIVTTPSDVALIDARRGLEMFKKLNVRVLGIVENMSYFLCPHCGEKTNIFSAGGGKATADKIHTPFLGDIPLDPFIRSTGDSGKPMMVADPNSAQAMRFGKVVNNIWAEIEKNIPAWNKSGCHFFSPVSSRDDLRG